MEYNVEVPIYVQVVRDIKKRIVRKQLLPGEKRLPTGNLPYYIRSIRTQRRGSIRRWRQRDTVTRSGDLEHSLRRTNRCRKNYERKWQKHC